MWENEYRHKKVLITGGLGMIGSSIARRLSQLGAEITILDARLPMYGANDFNIRDIPERPRIVETDIRDRGALERLDWDFHVIFNLAGQVSHNDSIENPYLDAEINYLGHLNVLEQVRKYNPKAKVFFSGSRLQFGRIQGNPVREDHPQQPLTPYALDKSAAENLYLFYHRIHGIPVVVFRIANPYGPRGQIQHSKYCIVNWFVRQAMEGKTITVFGDGAQIRDYIFIDDLVEACIQAAIHPQSSGEVFNVGSGIGVTFREMVTQIVQIAQRGKVAFVDWPASYINVETGDYISDIGKIKKILNWEPRIPLPVGISRTLQYYQQFWKHYA